MGKTAEMNNTSPEAYPLNAKTPYSTQFDYDGSLANKDQSNNLYPNLHAQTNDDDAEKPGHKSRNYRQEWK